MDLTKFLVLPGIIDLHGDGFERHLAPRRGAVKDLTGGLDALDSELGASGITTAVLAQFFSWEGGMRGPDFAERMAKAVNKYPAISDLKLQLRLEINLLQDYPRARALIDSAGITYVVFNDHLPHKALAAGKRPPRLTGQALKSGRSPEAHLAMLQALFAAREDVPNALSTLAEDLNRAGVTMGSHDDPDTNTRERFRRMGLNISEFPETLETALFARKGGDRIIMGAPNVVRGQSHDKKVSAREVILAGACDALVSDYHYAALKTAAVQLSRTEDLTWLAAWSLISSGPADVMGWNDRGRLEDGLRADITIIDAATMRIAGTIVGGVVSFMSGALVTRFINGGVIS